MANNSEQIIGDYGSQVLPQFSKTPLDTLKNLGDKYTFASGCDDTKCRKYDPMSIKEAVTGSDLIVACVGTGIKSLDDKFLSLSQISTNNLCGGAIPLG